MLKNRWIVTSQNEYLSAAFLSKRAKEVEGGLRGF